jgi:YD repeat-containing protein
LKTNALNQVTVTEYDLAGNRTKQTDAAGKITYWQYDVDNRVTAEIRKVGDTNPVPDADDAVTSYTYDEAGNMLTVTDPNGHTTTYAYDLLNRAPRPPMHWRTWHGLTTTRSASRRKSGKREPVAAQAGTLAYRWKEGTGSLASRCTIKNCRAPVHSMMMRVPSKLTARFPTVTFEVNPVPVVLTAGGSPVPIVMIAMNSPSPRATTPSLL